MEIQLWKDILNPYELAVEELLVKFNHLIKEYQDRGMYSPMEQVCGRVKSISSILDKAQKLSRVADAIIVLDNEMSTVRSEIMDAQNSCQIQTNLVKDILNNIQNLYTIANKRELVKIQDEFYRIYETKDLEQLRRFHSDLDNITEGYHVQAFE